MKTPITLCFTLVALAADAQESAPLRLWADAQRLGPVVQTIVTTGLVGELRIDLQGEVSSLEVGKGYTVTLFDREDGNGVNTIDLVGPCIVNDLKTLPQLGMRRNWDGAIASVNVGRTSVPSQSTPALAADMP